MVIHFKQTPLTLEPIIINDKEVERVGSFKILGVWVNHDLTWDTHVTKLLAKMSQRLYFLKQLHRSGAGTNDLFMYLKAIMRSIAEYACQAWHGSLTVNQSNLIEKQQERDLKIILPEKKMPMATSQKQAIMHVNSRS